MQQIADTRSVFKLVGSIPFPGIVADLELARRANAAGAGRDAVTRTTGGEAERAFEILVQLFPTSELFDVIDDYSKTSRILFRVSLMVEPRNEVREF